MKERDRKYYLAKLADKLAKGKISRRDFLGKAAKVGLSMSALGALTHLPLDRGSDFQKMRSLLPNLLKM